MTGPDPRVTPARPGLAARSLEGVMPADAYADGRVRQAIVPAAAIRRAPDAASEQMDQLLFGEHFEVLDEAGGWAWGQARRDGYVGHVAVADLGPRQAAATHRISALRSYAYAAPDIRAPALGLYSLNALARIEPASLDEGGGRFVRVAGAGWMALAHLSPVGVFEDDPASVAERFVGAPYLWGGRESLGLDCSGLTQVALLACGIACPRDADMQLAVGRPVEAGDLRRGDLVVWSDHVGMMLDEACLIHANGFHMAVAIEPLAVKLARRDRLGSGPPVGYRRP
jgi:cell wall-associated NlpC family hydrolase